MTALPLALYVAAWVAYLRYFARRDVSTGRLATALLAAGAVAHTYLIGMKTMQVGHVPVVGTAAAVSAFVWLLALSYLYTEMTTDERAMGIFIAPLLAILQILPTLRPEVSERPPVLESPWFAVHVLSLLVAYSSFALACVVSITYVLLFKEIKAKHLGVFYARLPSLDVLDLMNLRAVTVGWVFLTVGVAVGILWASEAQATSTDPRVQAMRLGDPKIFVALLCWLVYTFQLSARRVIGWSGRRAAWLSALGFALVLLNFVPVSYFLTESHRF